MKNKKISKYLSLILRHKPELANVQLDAQGWVQIEELIENSKDFSLSYELIQSIVNSNDKQRFAISEDGKKIRANQGHSVQVELGLAPITPPDILYHGTATRFMRSIKQSGLIKGERHHVHLTESKQTAIAVGERYGNAVLLGIKANSMFQLGAKFYKTQNNVWLVDHVPADKLLFDR
ncbi:RNA 2'-phosphotransferase [Pseudoalteromonas obscura]|uniref:Probable RNA 2'-phosphotransferase n=1 Tax=Pseudoalteromonas obscura TaxID=3048491 RepID=A0ABT7EK00_9GAMM|nr:RNA 2'-phosphotransferase [Pseudoalteromonas sp. P94(2023)]MDK2595372.1 RNA 2'-phosphotransferase [Pseudoalteromonas sp. P94(2023)]